MHMLMSHMSVPAGIIIYYKSMQMSGHADTSKVNLEARCRSRWLQNAVHLPLSLIQPTSFQVQALVHPKGIIQQQSTLLASHGLRSFMPSDSRSLLVSATLKPSPSRFLLGGPGSCSRERLRLRFLSPSRWLLSCSRPRSLHQSTDLMSAFE